MTPAEPTTPDKPTEPTETAPESLDGGFAAQGAGEEGEAAQGHSLRFRCVVTDGFTRCTHERGHLGFCSFEIDAFRHLSRLVAGNTTCAWLDERPGYPMCQDVGVEVCAAVEGFVPMGGW